MAGWSSSSTILAGARQRVAWALMPVAVLWLGVLWAAYGSRAPEKATSAPAAAPVLQAIAASGQPSPAGGSFDRFDIDGRAVAAAANQHGDVVFFATLLRSAADEGIFFASGSGIAKLVAVGDAVPSGERIAGFGERPAVALNEPGEVAFAAALTGGKATSGVFVARKGKIAAVALSGAAAPDIAGATLAQFEPPALNDAGDVAFLALTRRGREAGEAIYLQRRGRLVKLAGSGDAAPGGGIFLSFGNPSLNNKGELAFAAIVEQGPVLGGVFMGGGSDIHLALGIGSASPTGGIFARFSERLELDDAGTIALSAVLRNGGPDAAVFVIEDDTPRAMAAIGDPAPGGGSFAAFASWPALSQAGSVAFIASVDGGPNALALYLAGRGGLTRIAAVGDALPDNARLAAFPLYPAVAIGGRDAVTFAAAAERDGTRTATLFYYGPARGRR